MTRAQGRSSKKPHPPVGDAPEKERVTRSPHLNALGQEKVGYLTEAEALAAIPTAAPRQRMWEPSAYRCGECHLFHIGNMSLMPEWPLRPLGATLALTLPFVETLPG